MGMPEVCTSPPCSTARVPCSFQPSMPEVCTSPPCSTARVPCSLRPGTYRACATQRIVAGEIEYYLDVEEHGSVRLTQEHLGDSRVDWEVTGQITDGVALFNGPLIDRKGVPVALRSDAEGNYLVRGRFGFWQVGVVREFPVQETH